MLARFAELGGGQEPLGERPPEQWAAKFLRMFASRDVEGLMELHAEGYRRVDHRTLGRGETDNAEQHRLYESFFATASDVWGQIDEVLACDDRVIALTCTLRGRGNDGNGVFEIPFGAVATMENGLRTGEYQYRPEDRDAILARFAELSREP
jgi:hypothetical protein